MPAIVNTHNIPSATGGCTAYTTEDMQMWLACPDFEKGVINLRYTGNHPMCGAAPGYLAEYATDDWSRRSLVIFNTGGQRVTAGYFTPAQRAQYLLAYNLQRVSCACPPRATVQAPPGPVYSAVPIDFNVVGYIESLAARPYFS